MKNLLILSVTLLTLALNPALSNAMCIYSEGASRTNPNNGDTLDTLYVSFSAGLFHHYYTWQMKVGDSHDYHCVTEQSGRACVALTQNWSTSGASNCCIVEAHGCVFVNKDWPEDCRDPGEPFGGWKNCPSIKCITNEACNSLLEQ